MRLEEDDVGEPNRRYFPAGKLITMHVPAGRKPRKIYLFHTQDIKRLLALPFEKYVFLGNYVAICSYADGWIEAGLRMLEPGLDSILLRRVFGCQYDDETESERGYPTITLKDSSGIRLLLGPPSQSLKPFDMVLGGIADRLSLRIENVKVSQHDQALNLLERVAYALFFQIDLLLNIQLHISRETDGRRPDSGQCSEDEVAPLDFPKTEYDLAPMTLYWYARSASGMPLVQYLAYYQAIEFYFPTYSVAQARRVVRQMLKDPSFRIDRDADIGQIVSFLKGAQGIGVERSQLQATLQECVDPNALRRFLEDKRRRSFFESKTEGLTDVRIPIGDSKADLQNEVAYRIYDIRCKIVHTKRAGTQGEVELLLPYSPEAELLHNDIELIRYVAQQVLIAASSPLRT